ncbi:MAG: hypothetical protein RL497_1366, partial [Pseudomonadota bacterium]
HFSAEIDSAKSAYDQGLLAMGEGFIDVPRERSYSQEGLLDDYDNRLYDLSVEHDLNTAWTLKAGYSLYNTETYYRSVYAYASLKPGDTEADRYAWFGPEDFKTQTTWVQINGSFTTGSVEHHLVAGSQLFTMTGDAQAVETTADTINLYSYRYYNSKLNTAAYFPPANLTPEAGFITHQDDRAQGVFIQDQINLTEKLIAQLGLRYDTLERELDTAYYSPMEHFSADDHQTSPRAGLVYKITPQLSTYLSYSTSFGPGFDFEPSALYEPETAKQWEAGVKSSLLNNKATLTASLFQLTKQNLPTPNPNPLDPIKTLSVGEAQSRGFELDFLGEISPSTSIMANYAYTETEITEDFGGTQGKELPNAPKHQGGAWLHYDFPKALDGLSVGGGFTYSAKRFGDAKNTYSDGAYTQWDLFTAYSFSLRGNPATAQLNLTNLTDEHYYVMRARWTNMPAQPFAATGSLRLSF